MRAPGGKAGAFDLSDLILHAGDDVAFATALVHCSGEEGTGDRVELNVRLTLGLCKLDGRWKVVHEHHSVPVG